MNSRTRETLVVLRALRIYIYKHFPISANAMLLNVFRGETEESGSFIWQAMRDHEQQAREEISSETLRQALGVEKDASDEEVSKAAYLAGLGPKPEAMLARMLATISSEPSDCVTFSRDNERMRCETLANAAPEMLAVLEALVCDCNAKRYLSPALLGMAGEAIEKAEGTKGEEPQS